MVAAATEEEPIESVAARYVQIYMIHGPKKRRLELQAIAAHMIHRIGELETYVLINQVKSSWDLFDPSESKGAESPIRAPTKSFM